MIIECEECQDEFMLRDLHDENCVIEFDEYNKKDYVQIKIFCPTCETEVKWGRLNSDELLDP